jgi:putative transcriptional regulator
MIGNVLKEKRKELGISQEEMAEKLEVSRRYYGAIEANEELPSLSRLIKISKLLNMSIDEMISSEPPEEIEEPQEEYKPKSKSKHKYLSKNSKGTFCKAKYCMWRDHNGVCPGDGCMKEWQEQQRVNRLIKKSEGK